MGLQVAPGQLESLIATFHRINSKTPRARPEGLGTPTIEQMIVTKGRLLVGFPDGQMEVLTPDVEQVDEETYKGFTNLITDRIVEVLQAPHLTYNISEAMKGDGIIAYFNNITLVVAPLTAGIGELDQFPTE